MAAPPLVLNDLVRVAVVQKLHGQQVVNVLGYKVSVVGGTGNGYSQLNTVLNATGSVVPAMRDNQSNEVTYDKLELQKVAPVPISEVTTFTYTSISGNIAGNSLPSYCAAVITKRTGFAGRAFRGRMFLAGIPVTNELDSQLTAAAVTALLPLGTLLTSTLTDSGWTFIPQLLSRNPISGAWSGKEINGAVVRAILRAQRRREVGVGV